MGRPVTRATLTCAICGQRFEVPAHRASTARYCSRACYGKSCRTNTTKDPYYKRAVRAPGLSEKNRWALLAKWRKQGRRCTYCGGPCDSADHVIPLQRGGTNYEGNLTPCCTGCNSRKSHATIMEWRMGKKPARTVSPRPPRETRRKVPPLVLVLDVACCICGQVFTPKSPKHSACSSECSYERLKRSVRNQYRRKHGLPEDWDTPTRPNSRSATQNMK